MQTLADQLRIPVERPGVLETTAGGAARFAIRLRVDTAAESYRRRNRLQQRRSGVGKLRIGLRQYALAARRGGRMEVREGMSKVVLTIGPVSLRHKVDGQIELG